MSEFIGYECLPLRADMRYMFRECIKISGTFKLWLLGTPRGQFPLFIDFVELYAGGARLAKAFAQKGFVVLPPIDLKSGFDVE